jgi:hypothetical protein
MSIACVFILNAIGLFAMYSYLHYSFSHVFIDLFFTCYPISKTIPKYTRNNARNFQTNKVFKRSYSSEPSPVDTSNKLGSFYTQLLSTGVKVFKTTDNFVPIKKGMKVLEENLLEDIDYLLLFLQKGGRVIFRLENSGYICTQINLNKYTNSDGIKAVIISYLNRLNCTIVENGSGVIQVYFKNNNDLSLKSNTNRIAQCLLSHVDYFGSSRDTAWLFGPASNKDIVRSKPWNILDNMPGLFLPISGSEGNFKSDERTFFKSFQKDFIPETTTGVVWFNMDPFEALEATIHACKSFSWDDINNFNTYFLDTPLSAKRLEKLIEEASNTGYYTIDRKDVLLSRIEYDDFSINIDNDVLYCYNSDIALWEDCTVNYFKNNCSNTYTDRDKWISLKDLNIHLKNKIGDSHSKASLKFLEDRGLQESCVVISLIDAHIIYDFMNNKTIILDTLELKQLYVKKVLDITLEQFQSSLKTWGTPKFDDVSFLETCKKEFPKIVTFLEGVINYNNAATKDHVVGLILRYMCLLQMKNIPCLQQKVHIQRILYLVGFGGSGKSALVKMLGLCVDPEKFVTSDISNLKGRFEKFYLKDASLLVFNELPLHYSTGELGLNDIGEILGISGGDAVRAEIKFGDLVRIYIRAFTAIASNHRVFADSPALYTALRRRLISILCDNSIPMHMQDPNIIENIWSLEGDAFKLFSLAYIPHKGKLVNFLQTFDMESTLVNNKETCCYEKQVDPIYSFLEESLVFTGNKKDKISLKQLYFLFIQYLVVRPNSTLPVGDWKEFVNFHEKDTRLTYTKVLGQNSSKTISDKYVLKMLGSINYLHSFNINAETCFKEYLDSRTMFSQYLVKKLAWKTHWYACKEPQTEKSGGDPYTISRILCLEGVTLNKSWLEDNPQFTIPKVDSDVIYFDSFVNVDKWVSFLSEHSIELDGNFDLLWEKFSRNNNVSDCFFASVNIAKQGLKVVKDVIRIKDDVGITKVEEPTVRNVTRIKDDVGITKVEEPTVRNVTRIKDDVGITKVEELNNNLKIELNKIPKDRILINKIRANLRYYTKAKPGFPKSTLGNKNTILIKNSRKYTTRCNSSSAMVKIKLTLKEYLFELHTILVNSQKGISSSLHRVDLLKNRNVNSDLTVLENNLENPRSSIPLEKRKKLESIKLTMESILCIFNRELGENLGRLIFNIFINHLYYNLIEFKPTDAIMDTLEMTIAPFVSYCYRILAQDSNLGQNLMADKNNRITALEDNILLEKVDLKSMKKSMLAAEYKTGLKELNKSLIKVRSEKKELLNITNVDKFVLSKVINTLVLCGALPVEGKKNRAIRSVYFKDIQTANLLKSICKLRHKPMVVKPLKWKLNTESNTITSGGYLLNKHGYFYVFFTKNIEYSCDVTWKQDYVDKINFLQEQPHLFNLTSLLTILEYVWDRIKTKLVGLPYLHEKWKEAKLDVENNTDKESKNYGKYRAIANSYQKLVCGKESSVLAVLTSYVSLIEDLSQITNIDSENPLALYFPIHVDMVLRMYTKTLSGTILNKWTRLLQVYPVELKDSKIFDLEADDFYKRFYITTQIRKIKNLNDVFSRENIINLVPDENTRDKVKFLYYRKLYLEAKVNFVIGVDATAQVMQSYSLMFGDKFLAKACNLLGGDYSDIFLVLKSKFRKIDENECWTKDMLAVVENRKVLKQELSYYLYGSVSYSTRIRINEIYPNLTPDQVTIITTYIRGECIRFFGIANDLRIWSNKVVKNGYKITFTQQGNEFTTQYMVPSIKNISIPNFMYKGDENRFDISQVTGKVNYLKHKNTFLTTLLQSRDSQYAVEFRLEMWKKYRIRVSSIHDRFDIPPFVYKEVVELYRSILYKFVFNTKLSDIITTKFLKVENKAYLKSPLEIELYEEFYRIENNAENNKKAWSNEEIVGDNTGFPLFPE